MEYPAACIDLLCFSVDHWDHLGTLQRVPNPSFAYLRRYLCRYYSRDTNDGVSFLHFFGLSDAIGITIPDFAAGVITLTLNASAYIAEIVRGGIKAVPVGQMEASRSLGLTYTRTMQKSFCRKPSRS